MRHAGGRVCLLVNVIRDLSVERSSYGHIWTGNGVDLASWIRSNTSSQLAAHSLLAPHSVEDLTPFTGSCPLCVY